MRVLLSLVLGLVCMGSALAEPACRASKDLTDLGVRLPHLASAFAAGKEPVVVALRSEEHTSELQSH